MGFKYKEGRLTLKKKVGTIKGYIAEPGKEAEKKVSSYVCNVKKKKKVL